MRRKRKQITKTCDFCLKQYPRYDVYSIRLGNGKWIKICKYCFEKEVKRCSSCGDFYLVEDLENGTCLSCKTKFTKIISIPFSDFKINKGVKICVE